MAEPLTFLEDDPLLAVGPVSGGHTLVVRGGSLRARRLRGPRSHRRRGRWHRATFYFLWGSTELHSASATRGWRWRGCWLGWWRWSPPPPPPPLSGYVHMDFVGLNCSQWLSVNLPPSPVLKHLSDSFDSNPAGVENRQNVLHVVHNEWSMQTIDFRGCGSI